MLPNVEVVLSTVLYTSSVTALQFHSVCKLVSEQLCSFGGVPTVFQYAEQLSASYLASEQLKG